jgi:hypothetical protein
MWSEIRAESARVKYTGNNRQPSHESWMQLGRVSAIDFEGRTTWIVDAHRDDGKRFMVPADNKPSALVELARQVLTVTFYPESIRAAIPQSSPSIVARRG